MTDIEIYFGDLAEEKQIELLKAFKVEKPEDLNWDTIPIIVMRGI